MEYKNCREILFVIEVQGHAPEFWPTVAYRKSGAKQQSNEHLRQKEIKCPYCGKLFMIVCVTRRLDLIRFKKKERAYCHEYRKCHKCHESVGIIYISDETA